MNVNVYQDGGVWCFAAWAGEEFDVSDPIPADELAEYDDAVAWAEAKWPFATVREVE